MIDDSIGRKLLIYFKLDKLFLLNNCTCCNLNSTNLNDLKKIVMDDTIESKLLLLTKLFIDKLN